MHEKLPDPVPAPESVTAEGDPCFCDCRTTPTEQNPEATESSFDATYAFVHWDKINGGAEPQAGAG